MRMVRTKGSVRSAQWQSLISLGGCIRLQQRERQRRSLITFMCDSSSSDSRTLFCLAAGCLLCCLFSSLLSSAAGVADCEASLTALDLSAAAPALLAASASSAGCSVCWGALLGADWSAYSWASFSLPKRKSVLPSSSSVQHNGISHEP